MAGSERPVTVSIGIGVYEPGSSMGLGELMAKADAALYRAKGKWAQSRGSPDYK